MFNLQKKMLLSLAILLVLPLKVAATPGDMVPFVDDSTVSVLPKPEQNPLAAMTAAVALETISGQWRYMHDEAMLGVPCLIQLLELFAPEVAAQIKAVHQNIASAEDLVRFYAAYDAGAVVLIIVKALGKPFDTQKAYETANKIMAALYVDAGTKALSGANTEGKKVRQSWSLRYKIALDAALTEACSQTGVNFTLVLTEMVKAGFEQAEKSKALLDAHPELIIYMPKLYYLLFNSARGLFRACQQADILESLGLSKQRLSMTSYFDKDNGRQGGKRLLEHYNGKLVLLSHIESFFDEAVNTFTAAELVLRFYKKELDPVRFFNLFNRIKQIVGTGSNGRVSFAERVRLSACASSEQLQAKSKASQEALKLRLVAETARALGSTITV